MKIPTKDASDVAQLLSEKPGFNTSLLIDADQSEMQFVMSYSEHTQIYTDLEILEQSFSRLKETSEELDCQQLVGS